MKILVIIAMLCSAMSAQAAKLHGIITNRLSDTVEVSWWDAYSYTMESRKAALDTSGKFSLELPTSYAYNAFTLEHGGQATDLIVTRDADLRMNIDGKRFDESIQFSGTGSDVANFAAKHVRDIDLISGFGKQMRGLSLSAPDSAVAQGVRAVAVEHDFLEKTGQNLPAAFKNWWEGYYTYNYYHTLLQYPFFREVKRKGSYEVDTIPQENYAVLRAVPLRYDDALVGHPPYQRYVVDVHGTMAEAKDGRVPRAARYTRDSSLRVTAPASMPTATAELYYAEAIRRDLYKGNSLENGVASLANFKSRYPSSHYLRSLERNADARKRLGPGQPAPDFTFTVGGKPMRLSDLKGQVVVLDFWASWCGPCIAEVPHAKKLEAHFAGKPVTFLAVSIDESYGAWSAAIKKHSLGGMHTRVDGGWQAESAKLYNVSGVPSYFLIDKEGKLAGDAEPRPSNGEATVNMIEALLK